MAARCCPAFSKGSARRCKAFKINDLNGLYEDLRESGCSEIATVKKGIFMRAEPKPEMTGVVMSCCGIVTL
jgi:hypothetical protein